MQDEIIRVLRVLEYVGPRKAVEFHLRHAGMPGNGERTFPVGARGESFGELTIKSATVGTFSEVLPEKIGGGPLAQDQP